MYAALFLSENCCSIIISLVTYFNLGKVNSLVTKLFRMFVWKNSSASSYVMVKWCPFVSGNVAAIHAPQNEAIPKIV